MIGPLFQTRLQIPARLHPGLTFGRQKSVVHRLALTLVMATIISGAVVFSEPAPVDVLSIGLIVGLPVIGLVAVTPALVAFLAVWLMIAAAHIFAATLSGDWNASFTYSAISLYLCVFAFVMAAFVARRPAAHAHLILNGYLAATVLATLAAVAGYFDLIPGASDLFTKFERASGPFKDPNVFGPFLCLGLIWALHLALQVRGPARLVAGALLALIAAGLFLSFSRGAWAMGVFAIAVYAALSLLTAKTHREQIKLITLGLCATAAAALAIVTSAQTDAIGDLLAERAQLLQTYDAGHEGRFGGQSKAVDVIVDNPFGIGATQFVPAHHTEEVHNVYLTMLLNAGWFGGTLYAAFIGFTIILGLRHAFRRTQTQPLFIVAFAALLAVVGEGMVIDTDHWRHFYLLTALVWGLMTSDRRIVRAPRLIANLKGMCRHSSMATWRPRRAARLLGRSGRGYRTLVTRGPRITGSVAVQS